MYVCNIFIGLEKNSELNKTQIYGYLLEHLTANIFDIPKAILFTGEDETFPNNIYNASAHFHKGILPPSLPSLGTRTGTFSISTFPLKQWVYVLLYGYLFFLVGECNEIWGGFRDDEPTYSILF